MNVREDFIDIVLRYFDESGFQAKCPSFPIIECDQNGNKTHKMVVTNNIFINQESLEKNVVIQILVFFSLLDNYIDEQYPHLAELSFRRKYEGLSDYDENGDDNNDKKRIVQEIFRIFKLIRNACVHSLSNVKITTNGLDIQYIFNSTTYKLNISKHGFELLISIILIIFNEKIQPHKYKLGILRTYYKEIIDSITVLEDDIAQGIKNTLEEFSGDMFLKINQRNQVINPVSEYLNNKIQIEDLNWNLFRQFNSSLDYYIEYLGKTYIVPDEILSEGGIELSQLEGLELVIN